MGQCILCLEKIVTEQFIEKNGINEPDPTSGPEIKIIPSMQREILLYPSWYPARDTVTTKNSTAITL